MSSRAARCLTPRPSRPLATLGVTLLLHQSRLERDRRRLESLRHRATVFGGSGLAVERAFVDIRDLRFAVQLDLGDLKAFADFVNVNRRGGVNSLGLEPAAAEAGRKRHRETAGVRGSDQLLRIRSLGIFESRSERVTPFERPAAEFHFSRTLAEISGPFRFSLSYWH